MPVNMPLHMPLYKTLAASAFLAALSLTGVAHADEKLAQKSGCLGCHKMDSKLIGPAFKDVAERYRGNQGALDVLTAKVKGGSKPGEALNWGTTPMPPSQAPEADVRTVIQWVLGQ